MNRSEERRDIIGLIPAAGQATRLQPLQCSKEIFPIGFHSKIHKLRQRPKAVCCYLIERMRHVGASKAFIVLRKGKWDIPEYLGDGKIMDMHLAYLIMDLPYGVPYTLDQAFPFIQDSMIVFGFPDIIYQPKDAFIKLLKKQEETGAEIVLGLFPAHQPRKMDMVDVATNGHVRRIVIKPKRTDLFYTWIIAIWTPSFTRFMHDYLTVRELKNSQEKSSSKNSSLKEIFVGDIIQIGIEKGMRLDTVLFPDGTYLDIGTPEDLEKAIGMNFMEKENFI